MIEFTNTLFINTTFGDEDKLRIRLLALNMAEFQSIPQIAPFVLDADATSIAQRWKRWSDRFDNLLVAMDVPA